MPRVVVTPGALNGLERCRRFLATKGPQAAGRAALAIQSRVAQLETRPGIGRPFADEADLRELVTRFGDSGYVALYRHAVTEDTVYVLAFRHQKEAGY